MLRAFRIGLIAGAVAWAILLTPFIGHAEGWRDATAIRAAEGWGGAPAVKAPAKTCVPVEQVRNELQGKGAAVGQLRPEIFKKFRDGLLADKAVHGDKSGLDKTDSAYGVFGLGDQDHVVMMFVAKGCVTGAIAIEAHKLHDLLVQAGGDKS